MKKRGSAKLLLGALVCAMALLPGAATADPQIAKVDNLGDALFWTPIVEFEELILTVTGPCGFDYRQVVKNGDQPFFKLDERTIDGVYRFNISREETVDPEVITLLKRAREENDLEAPKKLCRAGVLPSPPIAQASGFLVVDQKIIFDPDAREVPGRQLDLTAGGAAPAGFANAAAVPTKDFVINDDLIVDGSACIGFDCVNGEVFSFDTLRLKENNLRIKFDDTSVAGSFPRNDWQLTANDSANGGASKFSIEDITGGRTPFTVEANAPSNSLFVDDGGRIGRRTSTPVTEVHIIDGDTPTLRLQQDGSSGFEPQTWDVAGNETNFFVRDVTNGSALPFRIRPGAPSNSLFVDTDSDVGMGTSSPGASLHVRRTNGTAKAFVEEASATLGGRTLLQLTNNGAVAMSMTNQTSTWDFTSTANQFRIDRQGNADIEMIVDNNGNVTIPAGSAYLGSDRTKKRDIATVDPAEILAKVRSLPVSTWTWKDDIDYRHLGPMAQDFYATFGLGRDDVSIVPMDMAGVALAAIQGLNAELEVKNDEVDDLKARVAALEAMIEKLATDR